MNKKIETTNIVL